MWSLATRTSSPSASGAQTSIRGSGISPQTSGTLLGHCARCFARATGPQRTWGCQRCNYTGRGNESLECTLTTFRNSPTLLCKLHGSTPESYECSGHEGVITAGCFSLDGKHIASAASDKSTRVWSAANRTLLATLTEEEHTLPLVWTSCI